ncbi:hypothetical protein B0J13DRAFT_606162 [Dactylonectria estremocensis]|uniref:Zn(2)-C6 fungal-type domain-containing protein n=1 Tax=Dactylonectria estremocensis TaxID=1079267 RepID=A0A9P9F1U1_9HYPO|nr:hypothetical protein B0J13DRAFT_606162 [Dactylonectria estremocensis]
MWSTQSKEQSQMWSTHDLACAHCRARKIRCGRERPQCESCKRDGVDCRYSSPGKRINHVKLLCQNFEALEDQLNTIQGDLSALTSLVKGGGGAGPPLPLPGDDGLRDGFADEDASTGARRDRHVVRSEVYAIDRYHGPCSLFALCKEFHDDAVVQAQDPDTPSSSNTNDANSMTIRLLVEQMCADANREEHMDIPSEHSGICLPPRQFLNIVVGQFFKGADYATDLFVRSSFQAQLDRVYACPLDPMDEAWAVCFNIIVLLAIGKDQTTQNNSPFVQPFLQTLKMTVNNPRVFLAPRLINVQALALLSHIAEQYSPPGFAEVVFAQACLLARTMGLHQPRASSMGLATEEILEKQKVFRSLYIRDKSFAICRGSLSWLPTFDSSIAAPSNQASREETKYSPRVELARIQDEIYRHFHAAEAPSLSASKQAHLLSMLEQKLDHWAATHQVVKKATSSIERANLTLSFFATRLCICRSSDEPRLARLALKDAKASCVLFLVATTSHPDPQLVETLDHLLGRRRSASPFDTDEAGDAMFQPQPFSHDEADAAASVLPGLTASFPLAAVFLVAKNAALQPITGAEEASGRPEEEMLLLETLRDRFAAATDHDGIENLTQKLSRTLGSIVRVVRHKRFPGAGAGAGAGADADTTSSIIFNDLSSLHSNASSDSRRDGSGSRKDTPPDPDAPPTVTSTDDPLTTSTMLLPFMQPFESSPRGCSPWPAAGGLVLSPWPASSYKQQADASGPRAGKRPRLPSQTDMFDMTAAFAEHIQGHVQRPEDDPLAMFDFLAGANEIPVFDGNE